MDVLTGLAFVLILVLVVVNGVLVLRKKISIGRDDDDDPSHGATR